MEECRRTNPAFAGGSTKRKEARPHFFAMKKPTKKQIMKPLRTNHPSLAGVIPAPPWLRKAMDDSLKRHTTPEKALRQTQNSLEQRMLRTSVPLLKS
jgi:hypothetical protein